MESFEQTFGAKAQRKRPKVAAIDVEVTHSVLLWMQSSWKYQHIFSPLCTPK